VNRLLTPLATGFRLGVALRRAAYQRGWFPTRRLNRPVLSVGNLTVGGTGKTPLVVFVAERLLNCGWNPGILTRGYGRRRGADLIAIEPGAERRVEAREVGDEPVLLARALRRVPIVVGADRYRAGRRAEEQFNVDVHLLDDGFQHWSLARDVDIVALDVTQELSDRAVLPAGRLREPCSALERAHFVVLTRTELGDASPLENRVRAINPRAGIFRSTTALRSLVEVASGRPQRVEDLRGKPLHAFCGIGNPRAFFADLRHWGFTLAGETVFPDHHVYNPAELRQLAVRARAAGAVALLTTEKDAVNLPLRWTSETPIIACAIQSQIGEAEAFQEALIARLEAAKAEN
jgi:tetraacyldisaccharide 4'-kinase